MENNYECKTCNLSYKTKEGLTKHNKKYHSNNSDTKRKYICENCKREFNSRQTKWKHFQICNEKKEEIKEKFTDLTNKIKQLEDQVSKQPKTVIKKEIISDTTVQVNKQLIETFTNKLSNKDLTIAKLKEQTTINHTRPIKNNILTFESESPYKININNTVFIASGETNYFNGTQICKNFNKDIFTWLDLTETKTIITELNNSSDTNCYYYEANGLIWLHPTLTIILALWICPKFLAQSCSLLTNILESNNYLEKKLEKKLEKSDRKIDTLVSSLVKKQPRVAYPESNVVYLITTDAHVKARTYIIGKAENLTNRLSTYNKTCEHAVIYYRSCLTSKNMSVVEQIILNKLEPYREVANRDRFILPVDKNISFFIGVFNSACGFITGLTGSAARCSGEIEV